MVTCVRQPQKVNFNVRMETALSGGDKVLNGRITVDHPPAAEGQAGGAAAERGK